MEARGSTCSLLDAWGIMVQGALGLGALSTLAYKRQLETARRPFLIWLFDTSKQAISSGVGHMQNVALSELVFVRMHVVPTSPCVWYLVNLVLDTTLGTCAAYFALRSAEVFLSACADWLTPGCAQPVLEMASTGHYGSPPSFLRWVNQTLLWLVVVTVAKAVVAAFILAAAMPLHAVGLRTLAPLERYPRIEVVTVMLVAPLVLNVIQLWIQDNFLRLDHTWRGGGKDGLGCVASVLPTKAAYIKCSTRPAASGPPEARGLIGAAAGRSRGEPADAALERAESFSDD